MARTYLQLETYLQLDGVMRLFVIPDKASDFALIDFKSLGPRLRGDDILGILRGSMLRHV